MPVQDVHAGLDEPSPYRVFAIFDALRAGMDVPEIYQRTSIDRFFIASIARIVAAESSVSEPFDMENLRELKRVGLPDETIAAADGRAWVAEYAQPASQYAYNVENYVRYDPDTGEVSTVAHESLQGALEGKTLALEDGEGARRHRAASGLRPAPPSRR